MRRANAIKANVTDEELEIIKLHVEAAGMSISEFVRHSVLEYCGISVDRVSQLEKRIDELVMRIEEIENRDF